MQKRCRLASAATLQAQRFCKRSDSASCSSLAACCLLLTVFCSLLPAEFTKLGIAGAQFLKIGVGRSTGMGDAFVAVADDASATYWNPAGLALIPHNELLVSHVEWIAGVRHEYVSLVTPTAAGSFGFALTALSMGPIEETTIDDPQGTGQTFTASDVAFGVSYARRLTEKFTFGATAKVLQQSIWDMTAAGVAFDFGVHYNTGLRNLRLAMAISNFGPDLKYGGKQLQFDYTPDINWPWSQAPLTGELVTETYALPILFRFGLAYDLVSAPRTRVTVAADLVHYNDVNEKVDAGVEADLYGLRLRAGYILNTDAGYAGELGWEDGLSAGAGVAVHPFGKTALNIDYGYRNMGRLGPTHRIGLSIGF